MEKATRKILIIEDNADSVEPLRLLLEMNDHIVETASDGQSGIEKAADFKPEIIICDIALSDEMNGLEVASIIRKREDLKDVFLIALSGYGQKKDKLMSESAGFDCHLVKPPDFDVLLNLLQNPTI